MSRYVIAENAGEEHYRLRCGQAWALVHRETWDALSSGEQEGARVALRDAVRDGALEEVSLIVSRDNARTWSALARKRKGEAAPEAT